MCLPSPGDTQRITPPPPRTVAAAERGGWLVGWLLPLCPGARPGPPRLEATGGRGCVTRCASHVPRALGLTRAAPARSRSVPPPVSGTPGFTASRAAPCPTVPCFCGCAPASVLCPPPCLWCVRRASRGFLPASAGQGVSCRFASGAGWARRLALGAGPGALVPPPPRGPRVLLAPFLSGPSSHARAERGGGGGASGRGAPTRSASALPTPVTEAPGALRTPLDTPTTAPTRWGAPPGGFCPLLGIPSWV